MDAQTSTVTSMDTNGILPGALLTAPGTPNLPRSTELCEGFFASSRSGLLPTVMSHGFLVPYPTPPASAPGSSPGSWGARDNSNGDGMFRGFLERNILPRPDDGFNQLRPALKRNQSQNDSMPWRRSRKSSALTSVSNILSGSSVHATHPSDPAAHASTSSNTPNRCSSSDSAVYTLTSFLGLTKLTDGLLHTKNTPPLTPRALSTDGIDTPRKNSPSTLSEDISVLTSKLDRTNAPTPSASTTPENVAPVGPPKGKLLVKVVEARGLRPIHNPFVVCVFEWNESIAKAPKQDKAAVHNESRGKDDFSGGVPIKRSASDMGRAMAIPMKSRQSSTTSLSDHKTFRNGKELTDPRWDHEGVLYVQASTCYPTIV